MENREAKSKPPTRLQKRAPAALRLDQIANASNNNYPSNSADEANSSRCAIPLLSPLILSPPPFQEAEEEGKERRFAGGSSNDEKDINNNNLTTTTAQSSSSSSNGWQHPAVEALPDASSLFTFFQSQCVLVNRVQ